MNTVSPPFDWEDGKAGCYTLDRWNGMHHDALLSKPETRRALEQSAAADWILPFGKHKGKTLRETPREYLQWIVKQRDARGSFRKAQRFARLALLCGPEQLTKSPSGR